MTITKNLADIMYSVSKRKTVHYQPCTLSEHVIHYIWIVGVWSSKDEKADVVGNEIAEDSASG